MSALLQLLRPGLTTMVALSAVAGYLLAPGPEAPGGAALLAAGVFLLAGGASVLNQLQERHTDALMARTRNRPLAAGRLSPARGLATALLLAVAGLLFLAHTGSATPVALGLFTLAWYNGFYTPLKRRTAAALLAGALCGALPPMIGWAAAGGTLADPRIVLLAGLFFLWQIPHFWLLALRRSDDYRRAGLPTVADAFTPFQARRVTLVWSVALAAATLLLAAFGPLRGDLPRALGALAAAGLVFSAMGAWFRRPDAFRACLPARPELFLLLLIVALLLDGLTGDPRISTIAAGIGR